MENPSGRLTIGTLAAEAGVSVETIRFYQRRKLLPEPARPYGGIRRYGPAEAARVRFIKAAQRIGFTLDEIAQLLQLEDGTQCRQARDIAQHKLAEVRQKLDNLRRMEATLAQLVKRCGASRGRIACPLIASLQETPVSPRSEENPGSRTASRRASRSSGGGPREG